MSNKNENFMKYQSILGDINDQIEALEVMLLMVLLYDVSQFEDCGHGAIYILKNVRRQSEQLEEALRFAEENMPVKKTVEDLKETANLMKTAR